MKQYFETLSKQHVKVLHTEKEKHFFSSIDHFLNADSDNRSHFPAVIMDSLDGRITGANNDGKTDVMNTGIMFVRKLQHLDDDAAIETLQQEMKQLALSFAARMEYDADYCQTNDLKFLQEFHPGSVKYKYYGPVFDNCFGVLMSFQLGNIADWKYDAAEWNIE